MPGRAGPSQLASFAEQHLRVLAGRDVAALDLLAVAAVLATLFAHSAILSSWDLLLLSAIGAGSAAVALWRRRSPASYARWRQLPVALLRLTMASDVSAKVFYNGLRKWEFNGSPLHDWATYAHALVACSGAPALIVLALARPVQLWLHLLLHAMVLRHVVRCTPSLCSVPLLTHPFAQRATGAIYNALSTLTALAVPNEARPPAHGPDGQCRAVLILLQLLLSFLAPSLLVAAGEAATYRSWKRHWAAWQQHQEGDTVASEAQHDPSAAETEQGGSAPCTQLQWLDSRRNPFIRPPSCLAVRIYELVDTCLHPQDALDWPVAAAATALLFCSAWHLVLLMVPQ